MSTPAPKFEIVPLSPTPEDTFNAAKIFVLAFGHDNEFNRNLHVSPLPSPDEMRESFSRRIIPRLNKGDVQSYIARLTEDDVSVPGKSEEDEKKGVAVRGGKKGDVIGLMVWQPPKKGFKVDLPESMEEADDEEKKMYEGMNLEQYGRFMRLMMQGRKEVWGDRDHWALELLCIHPAYQRLALGSSLLDYSYANVTKSLPCHLEASPAGKGLYLKKGWTETGKVMKMPGWKVVDFPILIREVE